MNLARETKAAWEARQDVKVWARVVVTEELAGARYWSDRRGSEEGSHDDTKSESSKIQCQFPDGESFRPCFGPLIA